MNIIQTCLRAVIMILLIFLPFFTINAAESKSQCIQCHTNLKKLIRLCWEVEKIKSGTKGSTETSGEG